MMERVFICGHMPKNKPKKCEIIRVRCPTKEKNRMKHLASIYAEGNLSRWIRYAALEAVRRKISEEEYP